MGTELVMQREDQPLFEASQAATAAQPGSVGLPPWWRTFVFRLLSGRQLSVYMYLLTCMDGANECHPTTEEIRSFVGLNRPTMIFEALDVLDTYGFIVRHRRMLPSAGGRRNLYRRPPYDYTVLRLLECGLLDAQLRVRHIEDAYTPEITAELHHVLHAILGDRYTSYLNLPESERLELLTASLTALAHEPARDGPRAHLHSV
jgi:hypothetical protein